MMLTILSPYKHTTLSPPRRLTAMIDKCKSVDLTMGDPKALRSIIGRPRRRLICYESPTKLQEHTNHAHSDSSEVTGNSSKDKSKPIRQFRKRAYMVINYPIITLRSYLLLLIKNSLLIIEIY